MSRRLLLLLVFTVFPFALAAAPSARADMWKKEFAVSGVPEVRIHTNDGSIEIRTHDSKSVTARVITEGYKIADDDVRILSHQSGDTVDIEVTKPRQQWMGFNWGRHRIEVELEVPKTSNLDLRSGDGHIRVDDVHGKLSFSTGDGSIEARDLDGTLYAHTGDGHVRLTGRFDMLDVRTNDGSVDVTAERGSKMTANWSLNTGDGHVNLRIPGDLAADFHARTGDGHIDVDFPVTVSGHLRENHDIRGKINGGGPMLSIQTGDGSITVAQD